ncbi:MULTISPECIES: hypothetical protein [unclassified Endozoicomonas]|uniref:hypothetical protein n=1 Tax=unclassified Endozoicomonas TaxID=2644528 RepID=UPI003BB7E812
MHLAISWDISAQNPQWDQLNNQMLAVLSPYSWVRPLSTFYVVRVNGEVDRHNIFNGLTAVAQSSTMNQINFLISPLMSAGRYDGFLPQDAWVNINERTS